MNTAVRHSQFLDADEFLRTDQSEFGPAWRYELVDGTFEWIGGPDAAMALPSVGITVPLAALYERVLPEGA